MKIVLIGCGSAGSAILEQLNRDEHIITVIDQDKNRIEKIIGKYDVFGIVGNGASLDIQKEANVKDSDLVICTTSSDEINILSAIVAKKLGTKNTIIRVGNTEYYKQSYMIKDALGISMIVNPEFETANDIINMINLPSIAKVERFAKGRVTMVEILIEEGNPLIGESLITLNQKIETKVLICAIQRQDEVIIPSGNFVIEKGDMINFTADTNSLNSFLEELNLIKIPVKNIMIVGGSRIAYYLANELSEKKYDIKIIETRSQRAEELAELLPKVTIVNGDGTDHEVLMEEGIEAMDAFVALTNVDEENIIVSMYAKKLNVKKTIAKVKREGLVGIVGDLGIINHVSPKNIVANKVISYIRALSNSQGNNAVTVYRLVNGKVETLEFIIKSEADFCNKKLKDLKMVDNCLIGCIIRDNKVIIPDGDDCIQVNDNVIVVTTHKDFDDLEDVFE